MGYSAPPAGFENAMHGLRGGYVESGQSSRQHIDDMDHTRVVRQTPNQVTSHHPAVSSTKPAPGRPPCCAKCDGPHESDACPHFKKERDQHKDAWVMIGKKGKFDRPSDLPVVSSGRVVTQPGDGCCLFHSLSYGINDGSTGQSLRREICDFIVKNPDLEIGDDPLEDWVQYDGGGSVQTYTRRIAAGGWGGGIEMAAFTRMKNGNVDGYEKCPGGFKRISLFENPRARRTINVLYQGRSHYDALVL